MLDPRIAKDPDVIELKAAFEESVRLTFVAGGTSLQLQARLNRALLRAITHDKIPPSDFAVALNITPDLMTNLMTESLGKLIGNER